MSDDTAERARRLQEHLGNPPWLQCIGWDGETLILYARTRRRPPELPFTFEGVPVRFVPLGIVRPLAG